MIGNPGASSVTPYTMVFVGHADGSSTLSIVPEPAGSSVYDFNEVKPCDMHMTVEATYELGIRLMRHMFRDQLPIAMKGE